MYSTHIAIEFRAAALHQFTAIQECSHYKDYQFILEYVFD